MIARPRPASGEDAAADPLAQALGRGLRRGRPVRDGAGHPDAGGAVRPDGDRRRSPPERRVLHQLPLAPRRPGRHPVGLGRLHAGHARHRGVRRPGRHRRRDLPRGVRAQELADRHHRDQHHQPGRRALDRLRPAGAGPVRLHLRLRPEHPVGRPDAGAADPADRDRGHPRGAARHTAGGARRPPTPAAPPSGRSAATT